MVNDILSDGHMDRFEKIEKLEAVLSAITDTDTDASMDIPQISNSSSNNLCPKCVNSSVSNNVQVNNTKTGEEVGCQTYSTGDIVFTKVFVTEEEKQREKLLSSPKRTVK